MARADWRGLIKYFEDKTRFFLRTTKLNSADFGVPQVRQRVLLVGFREKEKADAFEWPKPTHSDDFLGVASNLKPYCSSSFALQFVDGLPNHELRNHSQRVIDRYKLVPQGGRDKKDHTDRIDSLKPSGTVLVGSGAGGGRPFIHPTEHRHITVREAARLQSFPDWWHFAGGPTASYRQVGNAVPPIMAKAVAKQILKVLL